MKRLAFFVILLLPLHAPAADPLEGLEESIQIALKKHGVPGVGVAVVQGGKPILLRGYGLKEAGKDDAVDEHTLFAIGSVTKSFTAAMAGMLVEEKKLGWNDSVRKHLPDFRMQDRFLSDEVTLRDCLSHRVGLPRYDLVWYGGTLKRSDLIGRLPRMKPAAPIRSRFIYNNILYLAAGEAAAKAAGTTWDEFIAERIFKPLGMTTANTSTTKINGETNAATPHMKKKGVPGAIPWRNIDNIGPAGSINASAADMAEYLKFQLSKGKVGDKRLLPADAFAAMHQPLINLPKAQISLNPDAKVNAYGMGWFISDFHGTPLVEHGGNIDGMSASVILLPEKKIGVCVLANLNSSILPEALGMDILDRLLEAEPRNLAVTSSLLAFVSEVGVEAAAEPNPKSQIQGTKPSYELKKYTGTYSDDLHSPVKIKLENDRLTLTLGSIRFDLDHWHYDTFIGTDQAGVWPKLLFTFDQSNSGGVDALRAWPQGDELRFRKTSSRTKDE